MGRTVLRLCQSILFLVDDRFYYAFLCYSIWTWYAPEPLVLCSAPRCSLSPPSFLSLLLKPMIGQPFRRCYWHGSSNSIKAFPTLLSWKTGIVEKFYEGTRPAPHQSSYSLLLCFFSAFTLSLLRRPAKNLPQTSCPPVEVIRSPPVSPAELRSFQQAKSIVFHQYPVFEEVAWGGVSLTHAYFTHRLRSASH